MEEFNEYEYLEKQLEGGKENTNGVREKDGERHKDRDRDRKDKDKKRSRDRDRDRDKDRDDKHRKHRRSDSRSHSHHRSHEERDRGRPRDHHTSKPRSPPPPPKMRARTPPEERALREKERELKEMDRDTRTVFAYNLPLRADERDIFEFFSQAGMVSDVRIIMDRNTRKSKGFAYIEFENREDIVNALALTGQQLMNQIVMVKSSEAEKNLAWEAAQQQQQQMNALNAMMGSGTGPCKLFVGNLHPNFTDVDLKQIFEPFGPLDLVQIMKDATGRPQGYGYVTFKSMADATKAVQQLNGLEIGGSALQVSIASVSPADQLATIGLTELDDGDDDGGGYKLSSTARASLMSRLAGGGTGANTVPVGMPLPQPPPLAQPQVNQALALEQGVLGPASPIPTQCLLLKNMFDPTQESEPNWDIDIGQDVKEECTKFGSISHVYVDKNSKGFVYLKFDAVDGASAASKGLNGRWFAGRQIAAEFQFTAIYNNHFKC